MRVLALLAAIMGFVCAACSSSGNGTLRTEQGDAQMPGALGDGAFVADGADAGGPPDNFDGLWEGTTNHGHRAAFLVQHGVIAHAVVFILESVSTATCVFAVVADGSATISDRKFDLPLKSGEKTLLLGTSPAPHLVGAFTGTTSAAGAAEYSATSGVICGGVLSVGGSSTTASEGWTVRRTGDGTDWNGSCASYCGAAALASCPGDDPTTCLSRCESVSEEYEIAGCAAPTVSLLQCAAGQTLQCDDAGAPAPPGTACNQQESAQASCFAMASDPVDSGAPAPSSNTSCPAPHVCVQNTTSTSAAAPYVCSLSATGYPITCASTADCTSAGFDSATVVCAGKSLGFPNDYCFQACSP